MVDQMNRDENIKKLVSLLDSIFDFLSKASQLEAFAGITANIENWSSDLRLSSQIRVLVMISQQVTECSHFICDYAKDTSYCMSILSHSHFLLKELLIIQGSELSSTQFLKLMTQSRSIKKSSPSSKPAFKTMLSCKPK